VNAPFGPLTVDVGADVPTGIAVTFAPATGACVVSSAVPFSVNGETVDACWIGDAVARVTNDARRIEQRIDAFAKLHAIASIAPVGAAP
jgi:hypothetical protein